MKSLKIAFFFVVVAVVKAYPSRDPSPVKTGKIQHLSEYYNNDHPNARPSRPTPINPDVVSEPKPEEKVHLTPPKDEEKSVHRERRSVNNVLNTTDVHSNATDVHRHQRQIDQSEAQDQPTTPKPTRAWWRRMNFQRSTEEPKTTAESEIPAKVDEVKSVEKKDSSEEEKKDEEKPGEKSDEDCEKEEDVEIKRITHQSVNIQRIETKSVPVIQPEDVPFKP
ncbi:hypothetical protein DMENIID0001_116980 [Sergentomyia squamirostris]